MSLVLSELCEKLKDIDEITLLERLNIDSEELVERFTDKIEDAFETLIKEFDGTEEERNE